MDAGQTNWKQEPPHRPLASPFHGLLRDSGPAQNADKTQTKCIQNRKRDFFNTSTPTTYNFNALTCLNFQVPDLNLNPSLNLNRPRPASSFNSCQLVSIRGRHTKLTKTDRFRPKLPGSYYTNKRPYCSAGFQPAVSQTSSLQPETESHDSRLKRDGRTLSLLPWGEG